MPKLGNVFAGAGLVVLLVSCGSDGTISGRDPGASPSTTVAESSIQINHAEVAVAQGHAVVADGNLPTRFSIADLTSDDPERLVPLGPPAAMMFHHLAQVGDRIVVVGNQCDGGVRDIDIDYVCDPGTALAYTYAPNTGKWSQIPVGIDGATFASATMLNSDTSVTTLNAVLRTPAAPKGARMLFTLDVDALTLIPQSLPPGYDEPLQGGSYQCFASDGAQTLMSTASSEDIPGSPASQIWWRATPSDKWSAVTMPPTGEHVWMPDRCIAGMLVASVADGDHRRLVMYSNATRTWRELPPHPEVAEGLVHGPSMDRRWVDGRIWTFDPERLAYVSTGAPEPRLGYVRWSVPWGADRVVALEDDAGPMYDEHQKMKLHISVVVTPRHG